MKDKTHQSFKPVHIISFVSYRLDHDECERAMLPTLEHASLVHSHIHHLTDQSDEAFAQTRNAIVYISVSTFFLFIAEICTLHASFSSSASLSIAGNPFQLSICNSSVLEITNSSA